MSFSAALGAVSPAFRTRVEAQLGAWRGGTDGWVQVAANIEHETALRIADFTSLLEAFGKALVTGEAAPRAWQQACWAHQFRGALMPTASVPAVLGRAIAVKYYADQVASGSAGQLTAVAAEKLLQRYAGKAPLPARVDRQLRQAFVGRYVVWATFSAITPGVNPFDGLSHTTQDILTAFGLGHISSAVALALIAYRPSTPTTSPPVHRPTVAEAGDFAYYRPWPDPSHSHGYTSPLPPNTAGLAAQPEVVHPELRGAGLLLPYHLTTP